MIGTDLSDDLPLVPFCAWRCPRCNDGKPFTYGRRGRLRYHRCQRCSTRYRSMMLDPGDLGTWGTEADELRDLRDLRDLLKRYAAIDNHTDESNRAWAAVWEAVEKTAG